MNFKNFTLFLLTVFIYTAAFAQPIIKKQWAAGGSLDDKFSSMALTKDGGWIAGGFSRSDISGEKTQNHRGSYDFWVVKYDSAGNIKWDKTIGGEHDDSLCALQQTIDGGYILGGSSLSNISGEKTANKIGNKDYWVVKLDKNGNVLWDKTIGGDKEDELAFIQQTSDGGYILGGSSRSNISGNKTANRIGSHDYWVVKLDKNGNVLWDKTIGGNDEDILTCLQQTADGGYIAGGHSASNISGNKTEIGRGRADYWVVKLNGRGNVQWDKTIGGNDIDKLTSLQQTTDGGYILGGYSRSRKSGEKTENSVQIDGVSTSDYWMVKLNSAGNLLWDKTIRGYAEDYLQSLQQTSDGGYILGGYSYFPRDSYSRYFIVKTDSVGSIQWTKNIGSYNLSYCYSVKEISKDQYLIGGYSNSRAVGDETVTLRGGYDYWIINLIYARYNTEKQVAVGSAALFSTMALTKDKGWIAGGFTSAYQGCGKTEDSKGSEDYWVVKYDSSGTKQWDKTVGGSDYDELAAIQQTSDGGYILGGHSASNKSGDKTEDSRGQGNTSDYWIVKLDNTGKIQWDKTFGGTGYDVLTALQQTSDGGYILGGSSNSDKSGEKTENNKGDNKNFGDYWVVKVDANGIVQWDKTIGGDFDDELKAIQQTGDGGFILGGYSNSNKSGDKTGERKGNYNDYWVVKLSSTGAIQWDKTIGSLGDDYLSALKVTGDEGYILGGYAPSGISGDKTEGGLCCSVDYWIVKLNSSGTIQWDKTISGDNSDYLTSLELTSDGGYLLVGYSNSDNFGDKTEDSRGSVDYWIVKTDENGIKQWDKTIGGSLGDECYSVKELSLNHYLIGGWSQSGISGDRTVTNCNTVLDPDYWIVKLNYIDPANLSASGLQNNNLIATSKINTGTSFLVYPNPAKDVVQIQTKGETNITLIDGVGRIVLTQIINGNGTINVSKLQSGMYYLRNNTTGETKKVLIAK